MGFPYLFRLLLDAHQLITPGNGSTIATHNYTWVFVNFCL